MSWDYFGRTSAPENHKLTQHFADKLDDAGLIEEGRDQANVRARRSALPPRSLQSSAPARIAAMTARAGDQCENCTRVLDPTDLIAPRSAVSGSTRLEVRDSKHLFLKQSQMVERLRTWIDSKG